VGTVEKREMQRKEKKLVAEWERESDSVVGCIQQGIMALREKEHGVEHIYGTRLMGGMDRETSLRRMYE